jgi:hypothetical protein
MRWRDAASGGSDNKVHISLGSDPEGTVASAKHPGNSLRMLSTRSWDPPSSYPFATLLTCTCVIS